MIGKELLPDFRFKIVCLSVHFIVLRSAGSFAIFKIFEDDELFQIGTLSCRPRMRSLILKVMQVVGYKLCLKAKK